MAVEQQFKDKFQTIFGHLAVPGKQATDNDLRSLMYGDYMGIKDENKFYDEITDLEQLREVGLCRDLGPVERGGLISRYGNSLDWWLNVEIW